MSAESAHLSTFGAETETEAEIWSTSRQEVVYELSIDTRSMTLDV